MKLAFLKQFFLFFLILCSVPGYGWQTSQMPIAPKINATAWVLYDMTSGHMLTSYLPDQKVEPASITKLMTAYLVFKAVKSGEIKLDQRVPVSETAWKMGGSKMFIEPNRPVTVEELIKGMIVQSGNDATVALAELIGGTEENFVQKMNRQAQQLGLKNTHYVNSTGMPDPNHYSSARDIVMLSMALIRNFPDFYRYYSIKEYQYNLSQPQYNRNRLLWLDSAVDGIKTGHTDSAGYCLVASKAIGSRRLISVVLGTDSEQKRAQESQKLLNFGFLHYEPVLLYKKGVPIAKIPLYKGSLNEVSIGYFKDFYVTLPKGAKDSMTVKLVRQHPLLAPIHKGKSVAKIQILLDGKPYVEYPVFALEAVGSAGWIGSFIDSIRLWFD